MIEANELRIGNYVNISVDWGSVTEVTGFRIDEMFLSDNKEYKCRMSVKGGSTEVDLSILIPIPLTEERLLKAGFEKLEGKCYSNSFVEIEINENTFIFYTQGNIVDIHSLHHLQNLYFALTGKELEIEL